MSKVIIDCGISLDGYFAGENRGPENPMGGVSALIHAWMFKQKAFWKHLHMDAGEEYGLDSERIDATIQRTGAYIMGKRMFEEGIVSWPEDLFQADVFVLTHEVREPLIQSGGTRFYFIQDGIASALEKARKSAGSKDVRIQGGANTIQQFLHAGLVEEMQIHIAPVFLGRGIRLLEGINTDIYNLELAQAIPTPLSLHCTYYLHKKS